MNETTDNIDSQDDEDADHKDTENGRYSIDIGLELFVVVSQVETEKYDRHHQHHIDEVYSVDKSIVELTIIRISYNSTQRLHQDISSKCLHGDMNSEKEQRGSKI